MQRIACEAKARSATLTGDPTVHAILVLINEPKQRSLFEEPIMHCKTRCGTISGPMKAFIETDDAVTCERCLDDAR